MYQLCVLYIYIIHTTGFADVGFQVCDSDSDMNI